MPIVLFILFIFLATASRDVNMRSHWGEDVHVLTVFLILLMTNSFGVVVGAVQGFMNGKM